MTRPPLAYASVCDGIGAAHAEEAANLACHAAAYALDLSPLTRTPTPTPTGATV